MTMHAFSDAAQYLSDAMGAADVRDAAREMESLGRVAGLLHTGRITEVAFVREVNAMHARLTASRVRGTIQLAPPTVPPWLLSQQRARGV